MQPGLIVYEPPTDDVFRLFQVFVFREAGIHLGPEKKALLQARLSRRMRELRLPSFISYFRYATKGANAAAETQLLIDLITTNETSFFREPRQFDYLRERVIPAWKEAWRAGKRAARVSVWSAGCSTGEEPYSIAMLLLDELGSLGWTVDVLGSDISTRVLETARRATWSIDRASQVPASYRNRFMLRGVGTRAGLVRAAPELREVVRFEYRNLMHELSTQNAYDLVFCRNVMIYFAPDTKRHVVETLLSQLAPDGLLLLGHAETLTDAQDNVRCVGPNTYTRRHHV